VEKRAECRKERLAVASLTSGKRRPKRWLVSTKPNSVLNDTLVQRESRQAFRKEKKMQLKKKMTDKAIRFVEVHS